MDKEKQISINEMNSFLKGEYMAIDSYEKYINKVHDESAKKDMQTILENHRNNATKLSDRIKDLGGEPVKSVGFDGKIGEIMNSVKNIGKHADDDLCKQAYYWENKGSNMAEEIVKGDLDKDSVKLVNEILSIDRDHLHTLESHFDIKELQ